VVDEGLRNVGREGLGERGELGFAGAGDERDVRAEADRVLYRVKPIEEDEGVVGERGAQEVYIVAGGRLHGGTIGLVGLGVQWRTLGLLAEMGLEGAGMTNGNGSDEQSLAFTMKYNPPMAPGTAERALREVKAVLDSVGVQFLLSSGTCLGAIRDNAIIPWDDDTDIMSIKGANGLTDAHVDTAVTAFRERGYYVYAVEGEHQTFSMIKDYVRTGWDCYRNEGDSVLVYPKTVIPLELLLNPRKISFLGERYLVPNPPEEYLRLKYGESWRTPKRAGEYEIDVVEKIASMDVAGSPCRLRVLDGDGTPVADAQVTLVGAGRATTDANGYTELVLPGPDWYALVIRFAGHEQVLYMEELEPGGAYVYRADAAVRAVAAAGGTTGTLGKLLTSE